MMNVLTSVFHSGDEATGLFKSKIVPESIYTEPDYQESDFKKLHVEDR